MRYFSVAREKTINIGHARVKTRFTGHGKIARARIFLTRAPFCPILRSIYGARASARGKSQPQHVHAHYQKVPSHRFLFARHLACPPPRHRAMMPPRCCGSSGYAGVRARPAGKFYAEIRTGDSRIGVGTFETAHEAGRAYDAAAWRLGRPRQSMNFNDIATAEQLQ
jgi:hypothetical protein